MALDIHQILALLPGAGDRFKKEAKVADSKLILDLRTLFNDVPFWLRRPILQRQADNRAYAHDGRSTKENRHRYPPQYLHQHAGENRPMRTSDDPVDGDITYYVWDTLEIEETSFGNDFPPGYCLTDSGVSAKGAKGALFKETYDEAHDRPNLFKYRGRTHLYCFPRGREDLLFAAYYKGGDSETDTHPDDTSTRDNGARELLDLPPKILL
ncbi:hypothetical protein K458DRAFT_392150 [Lentithecium fluviatile CBS 122367]|uniref:Uncharacterized protein n=1 Tax=Lentithecium fluviatile CBS 122367 TaxID=1168545 RepID=A0A6G1ISX6_9PLEO|nr:hypothetical protein K458DRAFT_392150 [Lentithecium fluviatile CBS 122367]